MDPFNKIKRWWQARTGQQDTPFDGESPYWVVSLLFHLGILVLLAVTMIDGDIPRQAIEVFAPEIQDEEEVLDVAQEFEINDDFKEEIGANSENGELSALAQAEFVEALPEFSTDLDLAESINPDFEIDFKETAAIGKDVTNITIKGDVGVATDGAEGAIDRLTQEILNYAEERPTTVVWLFDQSASLLRQRADIHARIDRIYEELGVIEAVGAANLDAEDEPTILTSVFAFGSKVSKLIEPTDRVREIKQAIEDIERDDTGVERVFTALFTAAKEFEPLRKIDRRTKAPKRNVMFIVVSDEAGDDIEGLDPTINYCRKLEIPVYVIGVPAPFGRKDTPVKWVDPDPAYNQTPQWTSVNQGPESLVPERLQLHFAGQFEDRAPLDSGFGPFALTRICYETGGIYFTVHPNRKTGRKIRRRETEALTSYFGYFFEPETMRRYRPDYVSTDEYWRIVNQNRCRSALVQTAQQSWVSQMSEPTLRFEKLSEAAFVNAVSMAQRKAAILEPKINMLYSSLRLGEDDRSTETAPRWQAGFDLAMGRVLAVKVRTESYNMILAKAKTGLKFKNKRSNVWVLRPSNEVSTGSKATKEAEKAKSYLQRVVDEHPGTPWALMAQRELSTPMSWQWKEEYKAPPKPPAGSTAKKKATPTPPPVNKGPRAGRDERARMLAKPKATRPPPKL